MDARWRKSTRSGSNGACVEARYIDGSAQVRDTKDAGSGPILSFDPPTWADFVQAVKLGTFDR